MSLRRALLLVSFLFVPTPSGAIDWAIETLDTDGGAGYRASLALDSQGIPHIVYLDQTGLEARYATRFDGAWDIQVIGDWDVRMGPGTIILPGDIPAFTSGGLFYVRSGESWPFEDMGTFGFWCSAVALGPDGTVHGIAQSSWGSGSYIGFVEVVQRHDGVWSPATHLMDTIFYPTEPSQSMAVDANGNPHASFTTTAGDPLRYWHRESGMWLIEEMMPGMWSSIALDAQGSPRISFYDQVGTNLVMATRGGNGWTTTPIDQTGDVGLQPSQAVFNGVSYVSYYDKTNGDLKYAAFAGANQFTITPIDTEGDVGAWTSLAFDAQGRPHIAYQDVANGALKYAVGNSVVTTQKSTLGRVKSLYRK